MKSSKIIALSGVLILVLVLGLLVGRCTVSKPAAEEHVTASAIDTSSEPEIWTCSMHPQIQQPEPGDCPICGMDLIPLEEESGSEDGPRTLSMSESSRALANIQTTTVERTYPELSVRLVGTLVYDETREKSLTARFPARIDRLFVNYKGIAVERGEHLAEVYSPELFSAQRELLAAHRSAPDGTLASAAREKLRLWDLMPRQIDAILERGKAQERLELLAPIGGVVVEKRVDEGDYVQTGQPLFRIVDLSELWLVLDAYESDLPWLRYGQEVEFNVEAYPGETFSGRISFIEPELNLKTRTVRVRVNVPNSESRLKPGMFARAWVHTRIADDGDVYVPDLAGKWISPMHPEIVKDGPGQCDICGMDLVPAEELGFVGGDREEEAPLVVPSSAVLRTGKRAVVYVKVPDAERPAYEGREVVLGPRAGDQFIVESGLEAGEAVVTNGAFKIDSALQIQAKPSMMSPVEAETEEASGSSELALSAETAQAILPDYLSLQDALTRDDLEAAKAALKVIMQTTGHQGALAKLIHSMMVAEDLDTLRKPHFETLSNALIGAVNEAPKQFDTPLYQMHCPMVYGDRGADWLQAEETLRNPYFGPAMLGCGEVVKEFGQ